MFAEVVNVMRRRLIFSASIQNIKMGLFLLQQQYAVLNLTVFLLRRAYFRLCVWTCNTLTVNSVAPEYWQNIYRWLSNSSQQRVGCVSLSGGIQSRRIDALCFVLTPPPCCSQEASEAGKTWPPSRKNLFIRRRTCGSQHLPLWPGIYFNSYLFSLNSENIQSRHVRVHSSFLLRMSQISQVSSTVCLLFC